jgi:hypothetical protein
MEICSHIYFLFYHDYAFDHQIDDDTVLLENNENKQPLLESFLEGSNEIENIISGESFESKDTQSESQQTNFKYFSFCENNLNPKSLPFSLALQSLLNEANYLEEEENQDSISQFKEQDLELKIHSGLMNMNDEELDNDALDIILGNQRDDGTRQYGVGVDTLRLLVSAMDQGNFNNQKIMGQSMPK